MRELTYLWGCAYVCWPTYTYVSWNTRAYVWWPTYTYVSWNTRAYVCWPTCAYVPYPNWLNTRGLMIPKFPAMLPRFPTCCILRSWRSFGRLLINLILMIILDWIINHSISYRWLIYQLIDLFLKKIQIEFID